LTTPEQNVYSGAATSVVVPAEDGLLGILPRHAPLVGSLGFGELRITTPSGTERFVIDGGFVLVTPGAVNVLAAKASRRSSLVLADEEAKLAELRSARPTLRTPLEDREIWDHAVDVAKRRVGLARRAS
jgi:F-type H+-transporting ATPase subunit epsilon